MCRTALAVLVAAAGIAGCGGAAPGSRSAPGATAAPARPAHAHRAARGARLARNTAWRAIPRGAHPGGARVPILMYHVIKAAPPGTPYPALWVPPQRFTATVRALAAAGYHGVTLDRVWAHWRRGAPLPPKPIVVSFDDGYPSQEQHAMPALRRLGWPGVLSLEVKNVAPGEMSAGQVRRLIAAGWEIDSHTVTHPDLRTLGDAALRRELVDSRAWLRRTFRVPADFLCYPAGRYDARVAAAARAAGYDGATTVEPGIATPATDPMALPRIRVNAEDDAATVLAHVRSGTASPGAGPLD
jgi:peptidoglycan/xylan/chitin deacetylase (PgdA/CDA1 family)